MGIDALQHWRQVGLLQPVGGNPDLKMLGYQVRGWNFETAREAKLAADKALVVPLHSWKDGSHFTADFELPAGTLPQLELGVKMGETSPVRDFSVTKLTLASWSMIVDRSHSSPSSFTPTLLLASPRPMSAATLLAGTGWS